MSKEAQSFSAGGGQKEEKLAGVLEEVLESWERGLPLSAEDLRKRYPELAEDLEACLESLRFLQVVRSPRSKISPIHVGQRLGGYLLVRELGRGGMGVVYEARHLALDRPVALKVLLGAGQLSEERRRQFLQEARTAANLHHTHIVPIFDVGEFNGLPYYAMQLIRGCSLAQILHFLRRATRAGNDGLGPVESDSERSACPPTVSVLEEAAWGSAGGDTQQEPTGGPSSSDGEPVLRYLSPHSPFLGEPFLSSYFRHIAILVAQAARALDYAHQRGVIHRDMKPSNLLLDRDENIWITDFGLAIQTEPGQEIAPSDLVGTPIYMSPEQVWPRGRKLDHRTDVYSLGATLYELATLRPIYEGKSALTVLAALVSQDPPRPRRVNPRVPKDLEAIILRACARDPDRRYLTAGALADDLERFVRHEPTSARPIGPAGRLWRWCRRHPATASVVTVAASIIVGIATLAHRQVRQERDEAIAARRQAEFTAQVAQQAGATARSRLWDALLQQARVVRWSQAAGRRSRALELVRQAAEMQVTQELVDEAVAALATPEAAVGPYQTVNGFVRLTRFLEQGHELLVAARSDDPELDTIYLVDGELRKPPQIVVSGDGLAIDAVGLPGGAVQVLYWVNLGRDRAGWEVNRLARLDLWDGRSRARVPLSDATGLDLDWAKFTRDGSFVVAARRSDGSVWVWQLGDSPSLEPKVFKTVPWSTVCLGPGVRELTLIDRETGNVHVWDLVSGQERPNAWRQPLGNAERRVIAWDPAGKLLAVGTEFGTVTIWSYERTEPLYVLGGHRGPIAEIAFSPDQELVATRSWADSGVRLWRVPTGELVAVLREHGGLATALEFNPDGRHLVAGTRSGRLQSWSLEIPDEARVVTLMAGPFRYARYCPTDSDVLVVATTAGKVAVVNKVTRNILAENILPPDVPAWKRCNRLSLDPIRRAVLWSSYDATVWSWSPKHDSPQLVLEGSNSFLRGGQAVVQGERLVRVLGRTLEIWNYDQDNLQRVYELTLPGRFATDLDLFGPLLVVAVGPSEPQLLLYHLDAPEVTSVSVPLPAIALRTLLTTDGRAVYVGTLDGHVAMVPTEKPELKVLDRRSSAATALALQPSGRHLAAAFEDGSVCLWALPKFELKYQFPAGHAGPIQDLAFSPDGRSLLVCGEHLVEWDLSVVHEALVNLGLAVAGNPFPQASDTDTTAALAPTAKGSASGSR